MKKEPLKSATDDPKNPENTQPSRRNFLKSASLAAAALGMGGQAALASEKTQAPASASGKRTSAQAAKVAPASLPKGMNILFVISDQERYFDTTPFPAPGRERIRQQGTTFTNHQIASCVCSPSRSTIYTGRHIQETGVFDNSESVWQRDMSTDIETIGHRMQRAGYYPAYMGKWHLSRTLNTTIHPLTANPVQYTDAMEKYGFHDYYGMGDSIGYTLGGYLYDDFVTSGAINWMKSKGASLNGQHKPWFLAVNLVNPHDVMFVDPRSDQPRGTLTKRGVFPTATPPADELYDARWSTSLARTRKQPFDAPGRPRAHLEYMKANEDIVGGWPSTDGEWNALQNYYFNCIRDNDQQVVRLLDALDALGMADNTIVVMTADHGELNGAHQMWGKGTCTYREQNHVPFIISHPFYPGGKICEAVTSHVDVVPTLLQLTGMPDSQLSDLTRGLPGRSAAPLIANPQQAPAHALRAASLFNYHMLLFVDAQWCAEELRSLIEIGKPLSERLQQAGAFQPNLALRGAIRSVFDGRYRFSRYFSLLDYNTPRNLDELYAHNDVELYDLKADPDEVDNLAIDKSKHRDLLEAMNTLLNTTLAKEVSHDDGRELPMRDGKVTFVV